MPTTASALRRSIPAPRAAVPNHRTGSRSVDTLLRSLPSHGWTDGWVGRRDRALLVLWQRVGLSFDDIAALTVDDIDIRDGVATIRAGAGRPHTLRRSEDCLMCGPCALSRWLHALDLAAVHEDGRVVASVIARAAPLTAHSPHVCEGWTLASSGVTGAPVFPDVAHTGRTPIGPSGVALENRARHLLSG